MQSEGRPKRSWDSSVGQLSLKRRQTECEQCKRHEFPAQRAIGLGDGDFNGRGLACTAVLVFLTVLAKARTVRVNGVWERRTRQLLAA